MEKVMQPRRIIRLTEAEKKVLSSYAAYTEENMIKPLNSVITDKKIVK